MGQYLDVRALGLYDVGGLFSGRDFDAELARIDARWEGGPVECVDEGNGIYRVAWKIAKMRLRMDIWIDSKHGYTPIRGFCRHEPGATGDLMETYEVTWKEVSGVWVPRSYHGSFHLPLLLRRSIPRSPDHPERMEKTTYTSHTEVSLSLDWESVNAPVAQDYFAYDHFDLPKGTYMDDERPGGRGIFKIVGSDPRLCRCHQRRPPPRGESRPRALMALGSGTVLLCLLAAERANLDPVTSAFGHRAILAGLSNNGPLAAQMQQRAENWWCDGAVLPDAAN